MTKTEILGTTFSFGWYNNWLLMPLGWVWIFLRSFSGGCWWSSLPKRFIGPSSWGFSIRFGWRCCTDGLGFIFSLFSFWTWCFGWTRCCHWIQRFTRWGRRFSRGSLCSRLGRWGCCWSIWSNRSVDWCSCAGAITGWHFHTIRAAARAPHWGNSQQTKMAAITIIHLTWVGDWKFKTKVTV